MLRTCEKCGVDYDDAERSTICGHDFIMDPRDLEQKKAGLNLLGKRVRFAHMAADGIGYRVHGCGWNGMLMLEGMVGEFAPHLLVEIKPS